MQRTEKYQLALIETSDTFSPAPLNENMEKVEAALGAETAARQSGDAALDQRLAVIEARRMATGVYTGDGAVNRTIPLGFTPSAVFVHESIVSGECALAFPGYPSKVRSFGYLELEIVDGGFKTYGSRLNVDKSVFYYIAIL